MYAISIDSGGTKVVGAVVDEKGKILTKARHEIPVRNGDYLIDVFRDIINRYSSEYPIDVVSIGGNGRIDPVRGIILNCGVYQNWQGRHLREELQQTCRLPVSVNNDCYCAIKGELWQGAAREYSVVVGIIIGTGLGGAMADHGRFWHGARFGAGEIGHMILRPDGLPCYCGQKGCVERYVSGTALWNAYNRAVGEEQLSSGYEFFERYNGGDATARQVLSTFLDDLSVVMANISNLCDPDAILIGGGISETKEVWAQELENRYRHQVGDCMQKTKIVYASMGNDAALLGAAKFGFELLEHLSSEEGQK